jgi:hypothetical protein
MEWLVTTPVFEAEEHALRETYIEDVHAWLVDHSS